MDRRTRPTHVAPAHIGDALLPAATLVEILVALGIVAVALTILVSTFQLGVHGVAGVHEQTTAALLARSQMEVVKGAPWPGPYPAMDAPAPYAVFVSAAPGPSADLQVITVRVQRDGKDVLTVQGYKGKRQ